MTTFDYETAWLDAAQAAYKQLPGAVLLALGDVASTAADLRQIADCSMPWPEDSGKMRELFDRIPSEDLALAACVIHGYGHWWPGGTLAKDAPELPGRERGSHWKFAHYADQVLRERFGMAPRGDNGRARGFHLQIHEGAIRLCYSSEDMWTWHEIAPATDAGMEYARERSGRASRALAGINGAHKHKRDDAAYKAIEEIKAEPGAWAGDWWPLFHGEGFARYMIEEAELEARKAARRPEPDRAKLRADVIARAAKDISKIEIQRDGYLWLIDHGIPTDNAIYYDHVGRWAFGWRRAIPADLKSRMLDQLSEFPYDYDFKAPSV